MSTNPEEKLRAGQPIPDTDGAHGHPGDASTNSVPPEDVGDHAHGSGDDHGHGAGGAVDVAPEEKRNVPVSLYIAPLFILAIVLFLVWGPVTGAFAKYASNEAAGHADESTTSTGEHAAVEVTGTVEPVTPGLQATLVAQTPETGGAGGVQDGTVIPQPTNPLTEVPTNVAVLPTASVTAGTTSTPLPSPTTGASPTAATTTTALTTATVAATALASVTPVADVPSTFGDVASGALRQVEIAGQTFQVQPSNVVADWVFSRDAGVASWVDGTVMNYLVGLPVSDANSALFAGIKSGDSVRLTLLGGEVYTFQVDTIGRVNKDDTSVLAQDAPALTLLLLGDSGDDRAMVKGHFVQTS